MDAFTVTGQLIGRSLLLLNKLVPENFMQAQYSQTNDKICNIDVEVITISDKGFPILIKVL